MKIFISLRKFLWKLVKVWEIVQEFKWKLILVGFKKKKIGQNNKEKNKKKVNKEQGNNKGWKRRTAGRKKLKEKG